MKEGSKVRKIAFVGDHLPRKCGIATFTSDLLAAGAAAHPQSQCFSVSVNDINGGYDYPDVVRFEIDEQDLASYLHAADFLNTLVQIQPPQPQFVPSANSANLATIRVDNFESHLCVNRREILRLARYPGAYPMANADLFAFSFHPKIAIRTFVRFASIRETQTGDIVIEQKINQLFGDVESAGFGTGWWSGILSAFFGLLSFGAVLCLHFPQLLSSPELRPHYPMHTMRALIQCLIVGALLFGVISSILRKKKILALTGLLLATAATLLGGSSVPINQTLHDGPAIGLDWFLLDMFLMALIYVPLERLWPRYPAQGTFRKEWTLDVVYFMSTHLPIQILSFLVLLPATLATKYLGVPALQHFIARMPWLLQFFLAVVVADFAEYVIHLALHKVPFLWRFHAVHHSSKALDWIAGSRSHFVDDTLVRGFILVPLMFGFSQSIILAYLIFVTLHATWTHCNFGPNAKWLEKFLVMPRYHHWHHTSQKEGIDKNFAIHFPWIDKIFGTYYYPDYWPERYGLDGEEISSSFLGQTIEAFGIKRNSGLKT